MRSLSLTACSFKVEEKRANNDNMLAKIDLNAYRCGIEEDYQDFIDVFKKFCDEYQEFKSNDEEQKVFKIKKETLKIEETELYRYAYVTVSSGNYGLEAEIIDTTDDNKLVYKREGHQAEAMDFKVFYVIPKTEDGKVYKGIIIFQNISRYGIKTIFTDYFKSYIDLKLNLKATTGNICPEVYMKKLLDNHQIKTLIYTRNNVSNDISDDIGYGKEQRVITNISNNNKFKEYINRILNGSNRIYEFENQKYDGLKIEVDIHGRTRRINLVYIDRLSIIEEIPETVLDSSKKIDYDKLEEHFKIVTNEYIEYLVYRE